MTETGPVDFAGLFGDKDTLVIYTYMFGPQRERPCPMCTAALGPFDANAEDIGQNVSLVAVARSPMRSCWRGNRNAAGSTCGSIAT